MDFLYEATFTIIFVFVFLIIVAVVAEIQFEAKIDKLKDNSLSLSTEEFFNLRNTKIGSNGEKVASIYNFAGVYVLYNKSKNMYYGGQAKKVLDRVNAHFTGHGNGDVYADYKYGDIF